MELVGGVVVPVEGFVDVPGDGLSEDVGDMQGFIDGVPDGGTIDGPEDGDGVPPGLGSVIVPPNNCCNSCNKNCNNRRIKLLIVPFTCL